MEVTIVKYIIPQQKRVPIAVWSLQQKVRTNIEKIKLTLLISALLITCLLLKLDCKGGAKDASCCTSKLKCGEGGGDCDK